MKLTKLYIGAFGGLRDLTVELSDGFNCLFGENENGKTTLMAFIKMMFYGSGKGSRRLSENPRKKYKPWSGEPMNGRIYFEHGGIRRCLEREFRGSDSTDKVTLRNLDIGTSETVPPDIGNRFFSLGDAAFERSVFIGQPAFSVNEDAAGELGARLSSIATTGDEGVSYRQIQKRLENALADLKTPRKVGKYDKDAEKLAELENRLSAADAAARRRAELTRGIKKLSDELNAVQKECSEAKAVAERENDVKTAEQLRAFLEAKARLDGRYKAITLSDGTRADESFIKKVDFCLNRCRGENERLRILETDTERLSETVRMSDRRNAAENTEKADRLRERIEALNGELELLGAESADADRAVKNAEARRSEAENAKKKFNLPFLILSAAALAASVILFIMRLPIFGGAAALGGGVFLLLSLILRPADREALLSAEKNLVAARSAKASRDARRAELLNLLGSCSSQLNLIVSAVNADSAVLEQRKAELYEKRANIEEIKSKQAEYNNELFSLSDRFCDSHDLSEISSARDALGAAAKQVEVEKAALNSLARIIGNLSYGDAEKRLAEISDGAPVSESDILSAKQRLPMLQEKAIGLNGRQREAALELKHLLENSEDPSELTKQINELKLSLDGMESYYKATALSLEILDESFAELRRGYGAALEKETAEVFSGITGGKYKSLNISKTLEMETEADDVFGTHSIDYLSGGTVDQAYLSLRLAAAALISRDEPLPVFLDDSLSQCDDRRTERALRFLLDYSAKRQTVMFTCHRSVYNAAEALGAECREMK